MKAWPENNKQISFDDAIEPIKKVIDPVIKTYDETELPKYDGYNIGYNELACSFNPEYTFSKEGLEYHQEHGRDVVDVALGVAFQLGIEQGRRDVYKGLDIWINLAKRSLVLGDQLQIKFALDYILKALDK